MSFRVLIYSDMLNVPSLQENRGTNRRTLAWHSLDALLFELTTPPQPRPLSFAWYVNSLFKPEHGLDLL